MIVQRLTGPPQTCEICEKKQAIFEIISCDVPLWICSDCLIDHHKQIIDVLQDYWSTNDEV